MALLQRLLVASSILTFVLAQNCQIDSGLAGECISTSACSANGGTSEAGHCPGSASIQCCTYGSCTADGTSGQCVPTSTCSGQTTAGLCPGSTNIQCCTTGDGGGGGGGCGGCGGPVNAATEALIKEFEGFVASPEPDPIGLPTVGYGHLCKTEGCGEVPFSFPLTEDTATQLLRQDLPQFERCLDASVNVALNANQYGALASWVFNVGCGNMQSSTLVKRLNAGENPNTVAEEELPKWNKGGGQTLPGLVRRRAAEVKLFQTPSSDPGIC